MLPLKMLVMNTLHSFLDPTVYLLCRKVCEYESYTGIKIEARENSRAGCRVKCTFLQFGYENWRIMKKTNLL